MSAISFDLVDREMVIEGENLLRRTPILWDLIQWFDVRPIVHRSWCHMYRLGEIVSAFSSPIRDRVLHVTAYPGRYEGIVRYVEHYGIEHVAVQERIRRILEGPRQ
jgi:hypothetical protein